MPKEGEKKDVTDQTLFFLSPLCSVSEEKNLVQSQKLCSSFRNKLSLQRLDRGLRIDY